MVMNIKAIIAAAFIVAGLVPPALAQTWSGPGMGELGRGGPLRSSYVVTEPTTGRMIDYRDINACDTNGAGPQARRDRRLGVRGG